MIRNVAFSHHQQFKQCNKPKGVLLTKASWYLLWDVNSYKKRSSMSLFRTDNDPGARPAHQPRTRLGVEPAVSETGSQSRHIGWLHQRWGFWKYIRTQLLSVRVDSWDQFIKYLFRYPCFKYIPLKMYRSFIDTTAHCSFHVLCNFQLV